MTEKEAAKILRTISEKNLPTVDGIPFTEIKKALLMGAAVLAPVEEPLRNCEECVHRKPKRTESGTIWGCERWECNFTPFPHLKDDIDALIEEERQLDKDDGHLPGRMRE